MEELEDGSNKYYVNSQADYEAAVKSLLYPQGFAEYEGKVCVVHRGYYMGVQVS